jgi:hypothetical protein
MDVLGLADNPEHDQHEVYAEFREQLTRSEEGWYETGLPWKSNYPQSGPFLRIFPWGGIF